jgi:ribonuclease BN (tRNA processing enzyme)
MRITFLGTGSAMPTGERFQTGILLEAGDDCLLVDCGSGALHGLAGTDVGYEGVDTVLLTHHHLDHVSDLLVLLKARWLAGEESLTVVGPPGTPALVEDLLDVHDYLQGRADLTLRTVDATDGATIDDEEAVDEGSGDGHHEVGGFEVAATTTRHSVPCLAYRFSHPDDAGVFAFSGDSEAFPELASFADGAAVLAHDCSFPDDVDVSNHPTPRTLGGALADSGADIGRIYLTHFYPHTRGNEEEMLRSIGERYGGDVRIARDGLTVDVSESPDG